MKKVGYILLWTFLYSNIISTRSSEIGAACRFVEFGESTVKVAAELRGNLINIFGYLRDQKGSNVPPKILDYFHKVKKSFKYNSIDVFRLLPVVEQFVGKSFVDQFWILSEAIDGIVPDIDCEWSCKLSSLKTNQDFIEILKLVPNEVVLHDIVGEENVIGPLRKLDTILSGSQTVENTLFHAPLMKILEETAKRKSCFTEQFFGYLIPFYPWPRNDQALEISIYRLEMYFKSKHADFLQCKIYAHELYTVMGNPEKLLDFILYKLDSFKCVPHLISSIDKLIEIRQPETEDQSQKKQFLNVIRYFDVITIEYFPLEILFARDRIIRYINKMSTFLDTLDFPGHLFDRPEERLIAFLDYILLDKLHLVDSLITSIKAIQAHLLFAMGPQRADYSLLLTIVDAWNAPDLRDDIRAETRHIQEIISMESEALTAVVKASPPRSCSGVLNCYMEILNVLRKHPNFQGKIQQLQPPACVINTALFCYINTADLTIHVNLLNLLRNVDYDRYSPKAVAAAQQIAIFIRDNKINVDGISTSFVCTNEETLLMNLRNLLNNCAFKQIEDIIKYLSKEIQHQVDNPSVIIGNRGTSKVLMTIGDLQHMNTNTLIEIIKDISNTPLRELGFALKFIDEHKEQIDTLLQNVNCSADKVLTCFNKILSNISSADASLAGTMGFILTPATCDKVSCIYHVTIEQGSNALNPIHNYIKYKLEEALGNATNYLLKNDLLEVLEVIDSQDMRLIYQYLNADENCLLQFLQQIATSPNIEECARDSADSIIKYITGKQTPKTLNVCDLVKLNKDMQNMTSSLAVIAALEYAAQVMQMNEHQINKVLQSIPVDCSSLNSCITSLMIDALAENGNPTKNKILDIINLPSCNETNDCPWKNVAEIPIEALKKIWYEINQLQQNLNTPFSIQNLLNSFLEYLKSKDGLNKLTQEMIKGNNPLQSTILEFLKPDSKISPEIRKVLEKLSLYLQDGKLPTNLTLCDFVALMNRLLATTASQSIRDKAQRILKLIEENSDKYKKLIEGLVVSCNTLQDCIDKISATIITMPTSVERNTIIEILCEEQAKHQLNNKTIEEYLKHIIEVLLNQLQSNEIPEIIKLIRDQLLNYIKSNKLTEIIYKCMNQHEGTCSSSQLLKELKDSQNTPRDIYRMIDTLENYLKSKIVPTQIYLPILMDILNSLKAMTIDEIVQSEIDKKKEEIELHRQKVSKILDTIVAPCDTITSCVKLLLDEFCKGNDVISKLLSESLNVPSCDKTKCPWLQQGLDEKIFLQSQQIFDNIAELLNNPKLNLHVRLDLEQIVNALKKEDLTPYLIKLLNTEPHNILLSLLQDLPEYIVHRYIIKPNIQDVIQYLKSGVLPSHLDISTLKSLLNLIKKMSPDNEIVEHITNNINILSNMLGANTVISRLHVVCDTLENCVDSLIAALEQSPLENNRVLLLIYNSIKPRQCRRENCPWIKPEDSTTTFLKQLRSELIRKTQTNTVPLLMRLYAKQLAQLLKEDDLKKYLMDNGNKTSLPDILLGISQDDKLGLNLVDEALALYNFLTREELPTTLTQNDLIKIAEEMISKTSDMITQEEIKKTLEQLNNQTSSVEDLLKLCKFNCIQLKTCLSEIHTCAQRSLKTITKELLESLVKPSTCNIHVCSWMVEETPSSPKETLSHVEEILAEIRVAISGTELPFHLKLDLSQLAAALQKKDFGQVLTNSSQRDAVCLYMGSLMSGRNLIQTESIDGLKLLKLIEGIPLKVLYDTGIFENVNNIVDYFTRGSLPKYFDVNSFKIFVLVLGRRTKNADVEKYMKSHLETALKLPFLDNILGKLPVKCMTVQDCVVSIMKSLEKSPIAGHLFNLLSDIVQPSICNRTICNWVDYDSSPELIRSLIALREELADLTQGDDVVLIVKLYGQHLLKYITYEHLYPYTLKGTISLKNFLIQISLDNENESKVRYMANMIAYYLSGGKVPKKLTHEDFNPLTKEILDNTYDILIKQHMMGYTNRLLMHADELDNLLSKCSITCTSLKVCIAQIIACNEQYNTTISSILRLYVRPPLCDRQSCPWIPENQLSNLESISANDTSLGHILFLLQDEEGNIRPVLLDLNDKQVQTTILGLTNILGDNKRPLILKIRRSKNRMEHVYLDLTHPLVVKTLLKLIVGRKQFINLNTMKILTITVPRDGEVSGITFDLSNPEVRAKLISIAKSQTIVNPNLPAVTLLDVDGQEYKLSLDFQDIEGLQFLLSASENVINEEDDNILIFYLDDNGIWNTINYGALSTEAKIRLSKLRGYHVVGSGNNFVMTFCVMIPIHFDVYDKRITNELANIDSHYSSIIDLDIQKSVVIMIPDDYGQIQPVRVNLTDKNVAEIIKLSLVPLDSRARPTFILKCGDEVYPIYLNPESSKIRDFLGYQLNLESENDKERDIIYKLLGQLQGSITKLVGDNEVPFVIKLSLKQLGKLLQGGSSQNKLLECLRALPKSVLKQLEQLLNDSGLLTKFLESLSQDRLISLGLLDNVRDVLNFLKGVPVRNVLLPNTFQTLVKLLIQQTTDKNVALDMMIHADMLNTLTEFQEVLANIPVKCGTFKICISNLIKAIEFSDIDTSIKVILNNIITPPKCTNETCPWLPPRNNTCIKGTDEVPSPELTATLTSLTLELIKALKQLSNNTNTPYQIRLNLEAIEDAVSKVDALKRLLEDMQSVSQEYRKKLIKTLLNIADRLANGKLEIIDFVKLVLRHLPLNFFRRGGIVTNIENILNFFDKGIVPETLSLSEVEQLANHIGEILNDDIAKQYLITQLNDLKNTPNIKSELSAIRVKCTTFKVCVKSLNRAIQLRLDDDHTRKKLYLILHPQECGKSVCDVLNANGTDSEFMLLPIEVGTDFVFLDLNNANVVAFLKELSERNKSPYPSIIFSVLEGDKRHTISLDLKDVSTIHYLKQIEEGTAGEIAPYTIRYHNESVIVGRIRDQNGDLKCFMIKNDYDTYNCFKQFETGLDDCKVKLSFSNGDVCLKQWPDECNKSQIKPVTPIFPPDRNVQPEVITLPDKQQVTVIYDNLIAQLIALNTSSHEGATLLPFHTDKGVEFVYLNLHDVDALNILKNNSKNIAYVPKPNSVITMVVHDDYGDRSVIILDLNDEGVLNEIKKISKHVDTTSDNLISVTYIDDFGNSHPLVFDMNDLSLNTLERLSQQTNENLKPINLKLEDGSQLTAMIVRDSHGTKKPLVLNLTNEYVKNSLIAMGDTKNPSAVPVVIEGPDGISFTVYLDVKNADVANRLVELSEFTENINGVLLNKNVGNRNTQVLVIKGIGADATGAIELTLNTSDDNVIRKLKFLETQSIKNSPKYVFTDNKGQTHYIRLDTENPQVSKQLKDLADSISVTKSNIFAMKSGAESLIIDLNNPQVAYALISMNQQYKSKTGNVISVINPETNKATLVTIDTDNTNICALLRKLAAKTSPHLPSLEVEGINPGQTVTIVPVPGSNGKAKFKMLNGSNPEVIRQLKLISDLFNSQTKSVTLHDKDGNEITVYLNLKNDTVKDILNKLNEELRSFTMPPVNLVTTSIVNIPILQKGDEIILNCNISNNEVLNVLIRYGFAKPIANGHNFAIDVTDKDKVHHKINIDISDNKLYKKLSEICDHPPKAGDLLAITVKTDTNTTQSIIINTKERGIVERLLQLQNLTLWGHTPTTVQVQDFDGMVHTISLDLENSDVINGLLKLEAPLTNPVLLPGDTGEYTLLVVQVETSDGSRKTLILDTKDNETAAFLLQFTDSPNAVPLDIVTGAGKKRVYLDVKNKQIINKLRKLTQKTPRRSVLTINPTIIADTVISLPLLGANGHLVLVTIDLNSEDVRNIIIANSVPDSENARTVTVLNKEGASQSYHIPMNSTIFTDKLIEHSTSYEYQIEDGSILVLPIVSHGQSKYIVLDLKNEEVNNKLEELKTIGKKNNRTSMMYKDKHGHYVYSDLDLNDNASVKILETLEAFTPPNINTDIITPHGPRPLLLITYKDTTGHTKSIVLDTNDKGKIATLKQIKPVETSPESSVEIKFVDDDGVQQTIRVDLADAETCKTLRMLSQPSGGNHADALTNVGQTSDAGQVLNIIYRNDSGHEEQYTFDITNDEVVNALVALAASPDEPAIIIHVPTKNGGVVAVRINPQDRKVIDKLKRISNKKIVKMNTDCVLVLTILNEYHQSETVVLDTCNSDVVSGLKEISAETPNGVTATSITLTNSNGKKLPIRLMTDNLQVSQKIKALMQHTPSYTRPIRVDSILGPQKLIVFTIPDDHGDTTSIVLNPNNPQVVEMLKQLSTPGDSNAVSIDVIDSMGVPLKVFLNLESDYIRHSLGPICDLIPYVPGTLDKPPKGPMIITVEDSDGKSLELVLDTSDNNVVNELIDISYSTPDFGSNLVFNIINGDGKIQQLKLDVRDIRVQSRLRKVAKCNLLPSPHRIIPTYEGGEPLITFTIPTLEGHLHPITLDTNLPGIIETLQYLNATYRSVIALTVTTPDGKELTVHLNNDRKTIKKLDELMGKSPVYVNPIEVYLPHKSQALLPLLVNQKGYSVAVTLDTNSEEAYKTLAALEIPDAKHAIEIEFDLPDGKKTVRVDLNNPNTIRQLQILTKKNKIFVIPVSGSYPILSVRLDNGEIVKIDTNNQDAVNTIVELSKHTDNRMYPQTELVLKDQDGINVVVRIAFDNPAIRNHLQKLSKKTPFPSVRVIKPTYVDQPGEGEEEAEEEPIEILPPGNSIYPLISVEINGRIYTIDINKRDVLQALSDLCKLEVEDDNNNNKKTVIVIPDIDGNLMKFEIYLENSIVQEIIRELSALCPITFDDKKPLPGLIIELPDKYGNKQKVTLDFNDKAVLNTLVELSKRYDYANPYIIQISTSTGNQVLLIDFTDARVLDRLRDLFNENKEPFYASFDVPDPFGKIWKIVLNLENRTVMRRIIDRSDLTGDTPGAVTITLDMSDGQKKPIYFNLNDISTINLLKELTLLSTGRPAVSIDSPQQKNFFDITYIGKNGKTLKFTLDGNNRSVMKKLSQLSKMGRGKSSIEVNVTLPSGRNVVCKFDFQNKATLQNLYNLQEESLGGKSLPLLPIKVAPKYLVSFDVPLQDSSVVKVYLDLMLPGMIDKLKQLNSEYVPGRQEARINIASKDGKQKFVLTVDLSNPETLRKLGVLTEESIGENPMPPTLPDVIPMKSFLSISIPVSVETFQITIDILEPQVVAKVLSMNNDSAAQPCTFTVTDKTPEGEEMNVTVTLDTANRTVLNTLQELTYPTISATVAPPTSLITLIFLPVGYNRYSPIKLDLSDKVNVIHLIRISERNQRKMNHPSYLDVRDETGQYLRIPLDLTHPDIISDMTMQWNLTSCIYIDAKVLPYLILAIPRQGEAHDVIKFQLRPKMVEKVFKSIDSTNRNGVPIQITDSKRKIQSYYLDVLQEGLVDAMLAIDGVVAVKRMVPRNMLIISKIDEQGQAEMTYLNLTQRKTSQAFKKLKYNIRQPLTIVQFYENDVYEHFLIDAVNEANMEVLMDFGDTIVALQWHNFIQQTVMHAIIIKIPTFDGANEVMIKMNVADINVLQELRAIGSSYVEEAGHPKIILQAEDAYGFPLEVPIDYTNEVTVSRLKALDMGSYNSEQ